MSNFLNIDPKIRFIVLHKDAKWSVKRISQLLKKSESTVRDWVSKVDAGINILEMQAGRGRNSTISPERKAKVVRTTRRKPLRSTTRSLGSQYEMSKDTANRTLKSKKFKYQKVKQEVYISDQVKTDRKKFCKNMLKRRAEPLEEIFFSDEIGINLTEAERTKGWGGPRKKLKAEKPKKDVRVNCWGAISQNGATSLEIWTGTLDGPLYQDIVTSHISEMEDLYPGGFIFQHDNYGAHKYAEPELKGHGLNIVKFPSYSPDLSPIENLWGALKERVKKDNPKTKKKLIKSLETHWEELTTVEALEPYFENLYGKYKQYIEIRGDLLS